jgi:hypothetical protein
VAVDVGAATGTSGGVAGAADTTAGAASAARTTHRMASTVKPRKLFFICRFCRFCQRNGYHSADQ